MLALSWNIQTINGADAILSELKAHAGHAKPADFAIDPDRAAPRKVTRAGTSTIEAIFKFETAQGRGNGILRLTPDGDDGGILKAWTLLTALEELKDSRNSSELRGPAARPIRAIFAVPTGSTCARQQTSMPTATRPFSSSAAASPGYASRHG